MTARQFLQFLQAERYAVIATVSTGHTPQAAIVGIVVSDQFEIFLDTLDTSRKAANLQQNPRAAFVFGSTAPDAAVTAQVEGVVDEPTGPDRERLLALYFQIFPDGLARQNQPGITYLRVKPTWIRYSDFRQDPPHIHEFAPSDLQ